MGTEGREVWGTEGRELGGPIDAGRLVAEAHSADHRHFRIDTDGSCSINSINLRRISLLFQNVQNALCIDKKNIDWLFSNF